MTALEILKKEVTIKVYRIYDEDTDETFAIGDIDYLIDDLLGWYSEKAEGDDMELEEWLEEEGYEFILEFANNPIEYMKKYTELGYGWCIEEVTSITKSVQDLINN